MTLSTHILRDIPLRPKLTIISMLASGVALLLACGAFVTYELVTFKGAMIGDLSRAAGIVGHNSSAALVFDDPDSAAQTLQSLSTDVNVVGAVLYDRDGNAFAYYARSGLEQPFHPPRIEPAGNRFESNRLKLFHEFDFAGEQAGTVYIESDTDGLRARMARYGLIGLLVMLVSSGVAFLLSTKLQRAISKPISDLSAAVNVVRTENNYSVRAAKQGNDELGNLIEGFNAMLDQIQVQDTALQDARDHLERRVTERTQELQQEITEREQAQAELEDMHGQLVEASRQAGMAEVATNVLHNVGNVLNSVNVSAGVITEQVGQSRVVNLAKLATLLDEHEQDLGEFLSKDPRGKHIPEYFEQLSAHLLAEREAMLKELESLRNNIDHIKVIVSMQQSYSKVAGVKENMSIVDLVEDALRINEAGLRRHEIDIVREYADVPRFDAEKHKILQILVNILRNAKDACKVSTRRDKRITVRVESDHDCMRVSVIDNGIGIPPENVDRIFAHGFTTKENGHGFGLHSGALTARELGGTLRVRSDGVGRGAVFVLELPVQESESVAA